MPAPKGNQYAVGNEGGRPPKYDLEQEARDLLEWSLLDNATTLYKFTNEKDYCASELCEFARRSDVFAAALKKAKERIGDRREDQANDGILNYGIWNRWAPVYSDMLHQHEDELEERKHQRALAKIDYEIKKKNEIQSTVSEDISSQFSDLMNQIQKLQNKD